MRRSHRRSDGHTTFDSAGRSARGACAATSISRHATGLSPRDQTSRSFPARAAGKSADRLTGAVPRRTGDRARRLPPSTVATSSPGAPAAVGGVREREPPRARVGEAPRGQEPEAERPFRSAPPLPLPPRGGEAGPGVLDPEEEGAGRGRTHAEARGAPAVPSRVLE